MGIGYGSPMDGRGGPRTRPWLGRLTRGDRVAIAALIGAPLVLFVVPALVGFPLLTGDDVIQNYPLRVLAGEILRHGQLPVYNPYDWSGAPLLGGVNAGAAFPAIVLFALLPPLAAWVTTDVVAFAGAALGVYAFLRSGRLCPLAAAMGAAAYGLGGFLTSQAVHIDVVETGASLAWVLVGVERIAHGRRADRPLWIALAAAAGGCVGLAGSPEVAAYCFIAAMLYGGHLLVHARGERLRIASAFGCAATVAALVAAVQVLPGARTVASSQRADVAHGFASAGSLDGGQLLTLLAPHLLGGGPIGLRSYVGSYNLAEIDAYSGILSLVAIASLATRWRGDSARVWRIWYLVGGIGLLAALGSHTPWSLLAQHLPVIGTSRLPSRALVLYALASSVLLAHWADGVLRAGRRALDQRPGWEAVAGATPPVAVLALLGVVAVGGRQIARSIAGGPVGDWSVARVAPYLATSAVLAAGAAAFSVGHGLLPRRPRARLMLVLALADALLFTANQSSLAPVYASALRRPDPLAAALGRAVGPQGRFVVVDPSRSGGIALDRLGAPDLNVLGGPPSAQGYGSLVWAPYARATGTHGQDVLAPSAVAGSVLDALSVHVLLVTAASFEVRLHPGQVPAAVPIRLGRARPVTRLFGRKDAVTAVTLRAASGDRTDGATMRALAGTIRLLDARGLVEREVPGSTSTSGAGGEVTVSYRRPQVAAGLAFCGSVGAAVGGSAGGAISRLGVAVTVAGGARFSLSGPLASSATPPHWELAGSLGPYTVLHDSRASPALSSTGRASLRALASPAWGTVLRVSVRAPEPFTLVRSVADIPGWTATIDGNGHVRPVKIRRDGLVQEVALPAGRYVVVFSYETPGLSVGLLASAAGCLALLALLVARRWADPTATRRLRRPLVGADSRRRISRAPWAGKDSNLRRLCRQIYSLLPLATWVPTRRADTLSDRRTGAVPLGTASR